MEKENAILEYKEKECRSYLKTVSAFANYRTGNVVFGVSDDCCIKPIKDVKPFCENIENQINDSISPKPAFVLIPMEDGTVRLTVYKGDNLPYLFQGKAYKRNDTSTLEVDTFELRRLILEGQNKSFEETMNTNQTLTFTYLEKKLKETLHIEEFSLDTLKTLGLFSTKGGYNVAAGLLADTNSLPGLDIAVFGNNENIIKEKVPLFHISVLKQFFDSIGVFKRYYCYEEIAGATRNEVQLIPLEAFRESIANSLVHRTWDVNINTKVSFYPDKIVISSPGGLVDGLSEDDYLIGRFSALRNPILADVFRRLNIIEAFATGIKRIKRSYESSASKPIFEINSNSIVVTLPLMKKIILSSKEKALLSMMDDHRLYSREELEDLTSSNKFALIRTLNALIEKGFVTKSGQASSTEYRKR